MGTKWRGYLLDREWVDAEHAKGVKLNALLPSQLIEHARLGPFDIEGTGHHQARTALFDIVKRHGFPEKTRFTHLKAYLYVKNYVDGRGEGPPSALDLSDAFDNLKDAVGGESK